MNTVFYIGSEYEKAFKSICTLARAGHAGDIVTAVDDASGGNGARIHTAMYTFEYAANKHAKQTDGANKFTKEGASWFSVFRPGSKRESDGTAEWLDLMEKVATSFHRNYSYIEYKQTERKVDSAEYEKGRGKIAAILEKLMPDFSVRKGVNIRGGSEEESMEDIYGVSLRVELSSGTGVGVPVLAKVYFRANGNYLNYIPRREGEMIEQSINQKFAEMTQLESDQTDANFDAGDMQETSFVIDKVLGKLGDCVLDGELEKAICFNSAEDRESIQKLLSVQAHDAMSLDCTMIKVLGISHVRWLNSTYIVQSGTDKALRAIIGLNNTISLYCLNCQSEALVSNNVIGYMKNGVRVETVIDPSKSDLGLTSAQLSELLKYSDVSKHLMTPCKDESGRGKACERLVCQSEAVNYGDEKNPVYRCKNCPYPEIVFTDGDGVMRYTRKLTFARDALTMVDSVDKEGQTTTQKCPVCGRSFTVNGMVDGQCKLCAQAASDKADKTAHERYRHYKGMLPATTRLVGIGRRKECYEDADIILFRVGNKKYIVKKIDLRDEGYQPGPKRV